PIPGTTLHRRKSTTQSRHARVERGLAQLLYRGVLTPSVMRAVARPRLDDRDLRRHDAGRLAVRKRLKLGRVEGGRLAYGQHERIREEVREHPSTATRAILAAHSLPLRKQEEALPSRVDATNLNRGALALSTMELEDRRESPRPLPRAGISALDHPVNFRQGSHQSVTHFCPFHSMRTV
ncbi:MAG: hypothetical protein ACYCTH_12630, partial [Cellulomonas sp.]